ncbi:MAG: AAA family ATPase [Defluviitaleaceae bacterium]|nr:AAA family ATPase [Defluviitaleaceae bacterium]
MGNVTIKCTHDKTIFHNEDTGYSVISYQVANRDGDTVPFSARNTFNERYGKITFTAVGTRLSLAKEVEIELIGSWSDGNGNSKYGTQFSVESCTVIRPKTAEGMIAYLSSDLIKGIGDKTARAIVEHFGEETLDIIDKTPARLLEVKVITKKKLDSIIEGYRASVGLRDIMTELASYGVTPKKAEKILEVFGVQAVELVKANPYVLCRVSGFGFKTVDVMARKNGTSLDDPNRIAEGIIYAMEQSQQSGHLFLSSDELCKDATKLLCIDIGVDGSNGSYTINSGSNGVAKVNDSDCGSENVVSSQSGDGNVVGSVGNDSTTQKGKIHQGTTIQKVLLELVLEERLKEDSGRIYLPKNYVAERETARLARTMIRAIPVSRIEGVNDLGDAGDIKGLTDANEGFESIITQAEKVCGIMLDDMQREAVRMVTTNNISIITGGPGTGKTTVVKVIVEVYRMIIGGRVAFAAPTGRASRRLSESVDADAATIHSTLGMRGESESSSNYIDTDFLVVDEVSMVDMSLAYQLFKNLNPSTKLLLVGDDNQLPSVGAGNVLRELLQSGIIPVTKLETVHRQAQTSRINLNAHSILTNKGVGLTYGPDFEFIEAYDSDIAAEYVMKLFYQSVRQLKPNGKPFGVDGVQILSPMRRKGKCGTNALNAEIQAILNPPSEDRPDVSVGFKKFRLFDKVMQTKNSGSISNGDIGRIRKINGSLNGRDDTGTVGSKNASKDLRGDYEVHIDFGGGRIAVYDSDEMETIELAYATTIHKSQGSEYPIVIIPIINEAYIMLQRNLIYTAITRAKEKVILVGQREALFTAIRNTKAAQRNTVLGQLIAS